jgi:hypothetical protein
VSASLNASVAFLEALRARRLGCDHSRRGTRRIPVVGRMLGFTLIPGASRVPTGQSRRRQSFEPAEHFPLLSAQSRESQSRPARPSRNASSAAALRSASFRLWDSTRRTCGEIAARGPHRADGGHALSYAETVKRDRCAFQRYSLRLDWVVQYVEAMCKSRPVETEVPRPNAARRVDVKAANPRNNVRIESDAFRSPGKPLSPSADQNNSGAANA